VQQKVYERMIAERKRIADRFRSEGEGEASRINGERERELLRIQSGLPQAEEIKGRPMRGRASTPTRTTATRGAGILRVPQDQSYPAVLDSGSR
jgi:regulator of protease activity HflC (stomatin/prohibitin superfamily)